jgi:hypothetical protein
MTSLQKQIELPEARGNEAELLGQLACDPETRAHNRRQFRDEAQRVRLSRNWRCQDDKAIEAACRSLVMAPYRDPYTTLISISASALSGQQAQAGEALKAYLAGGRAGSKTIADCYSFAGREGGDGPQWPSMSPGILSLAA